MFGFLYFSLPGFGRPNFKEEIILGTPEGREERLMSVMLGVRGWKRTFPNPGKGTEECESAASGSVPVSWQNFIEGSELY